MLVNFRGRNTELQFVVRGSWPEFEGQVLQINTGCEQNDSRFVGFLEFVGFVEFVEVVEFVGSGDSSRGQAPERGQATSQGTECGSRVLGRTLKFLREKSSLSPYPIVAIR